MTTIWIMKTKNGFYPIEPSEKCKPEDHGRLNDHVVSIEDIDGNVLWDREYEEWFCAKVNDAMESDDPGTPHDEVMQELRA